MKHQVAVIGEGVIDRFVDADSTRDVIGGSPLNTAVALRRAGVDATWWNRVSTDPEGAAIFAYAEQNGVAGRGVIRVAAPTSVVRIQLNDHGVPSYTFELAGAADWSWSDADFAGLGSEYSLVQIGSLTCVLQPGSDALLKAVRGLRAGSNPPVISYDPNARPKAASDEADADRMRQRVLDFVAEADLIKVSDEDLEWLAPGVPPTATAMQWSANGPKLVIMTKGRQGSAAFVNGVKVADEPIIDLPLVDTVGAGDTFMAWLVRGIVTDHDCQIPSAPADISRLLQQATLASAINCSRAGCNPPLRAEVLEAD